jgi:hypothetical protein
MNAPLAKPQAGRRACAAELSRCPAKTSKPRALRGQPCKRATSGGSLPPPVRAHLRPRSFVVWHMMQPFVLRIAFFKRKHSV